MMLAAAAAPTKADDWENNGVFSCRKNVEGEWENPARIIIIYSKGWPENGQIIGVAA